ncbi:MAG: ribosome maturation factor RimP, partial [Clostridia bacterium]|nr:ribosome maturation factor RimP [Clostridia bacterium]
MSKITEKVHEFLNPIVQNLGYEIVDVEYEKKFDGFNLTIFIDGENGISLDDCEKVHTAIDEPLDELDPTNGASYTLNVSS